ncbi:outer membrane beta-barrel family protein [soil metagenome]
MKLCIILASALLALSTTGFSQSIISGKINDLETNGIAFANVLLRNNFDSVLVKGAVTDESGYFILSNIPNGNYIIESYMVGYSKSYSSIISLSQPGKINLGYIILVEDTRELDGVTIEASKPLYELEMGKMVINVQNSITSAGLSAIDVLERSPGVFVNRQNNAFSLSGKDGVIVLINGKRSRMPMDAVYQMLAGLNAGDIEKIEIMTVPPANYDSDGDAGFINIVMKRNNGLVGSNGTITAGLGYGSGTNGNFSLNLNHQGNKISWFGNYSLNYMEQLQIWENYRKSSNGAESVITSNESIRDTDRTSHNYQFGFDYQIGSNTIFSGLLSGFYNRFLNNAPTSAVFNYSLSPDTVIELTVTEKNLWRHLMGNINIHHTFKNGQVLNANLDYLTYDNNNPSKYNNRYYSESGSFILKEENRISKDTPIKMWVAKVDHSLKIGESVILESGIKGTFSELTNDVLFEEKKGEIWTENPSYSNYAYLTEDILAAFTSINIVVDEKTSINAGMRYEHTKTYLDTLGGVRLINRNYGNFFPSLFLSRKLNQNNIIQLSYGRRITRPTFNEMAPFVFFIDPYTFFSGNENILPTFTHNIKGDYSYKSFIFSLQYSLDKNVIMRFQPSIDPETNMLILASDNIDLRYTLAATFTIPFQFTKWWEMQNNLTANWQQITTELNEEFYQVGQKGFQINSTHTFKLPNKYTMELAGYYSSPVINGYFNWLARGFVNLGIQKEFSNGGALRFSCNDILETTQLRWKTFDESSFSFKGRLKFDKRRFVVTYTHKFGNNKVKGTRKRSVGSQEEQNRVTN